MLNAYHMLHSYYIIKFQTVEGEIFMEDKLWHSYHLSTFPFGCFIHLSFPEIRFHILKHFSTDTSNGSGFKESLFQSASFTGDSDISQPPNQKMYRITFFRFHSTVVLLDCWKHSYRRGALESLITSMNEIFVQY